MTAIKSNGVTIQSIELVTNIISFAPMVAFVLTFIILLVVMIIDANHLKKLGLWLGGGYFEAVLQQTEIPANSNATNESSNQSDIHYVQRLRVFSRLLRREYQILFIVVYVLYTLPLQAALVAILFIQNIFTEEFSSETCYRYLDFFSLKSDRYSCSIKDYIRHQSLNSSHVDVSNVTSYCTWQNETNAATSEDVVCRVFLFDKSKLIVAVGAVYGWHKILALGGVLFIHVQLVFTRKIRDKHLYYAATCFPPIIFLLGALMLYLEVANSDTISVTNALSALVGIPVFSVSIYYMARSFYHVTNTFEGRRAPNFSTSYIIVHDDEVERPLLSTQQE
jgi:hypothetical protein